MNADTVRQAASGRWPELLQWLGIPSAALTKKNKPCPCCGGTDRFSFIDKGAGRFICRALDRQGGDGFALVMHWLDSDFRTALTAIANLLGLSNTRGMAQVLPFHRNVALPTAQLAEDRSLKLAALWDSAKCLTSTSQAARYLASRGLVGMLDAYPEALRCVDRLPYWHQTKNGKPVMLGEFPALLARLTAPVGELAGIHRIYLESNGYKLDLLHDGERLPSKKLATVREGASNGSAIRLYSVTDGKLALAEGIETALAVHLGSGLPVWACVSAGGLTRVQLPPEARDVWVFADHDTSGTGQQAAERLARRLRNEGRQVRVLLPEEPGRDWLDVLNEPNQLDEQKEGRAA